MDAQTHITAADARAIVDAMGALVMAIGLQLTPMQQAGMAAALSAMAGQARRNGNAPAAQLIGDLVAAVPHAG